jgi:hypothetical protein
MEAAGLLRDMRWLRGRFHLQARSLRGGFGGLDTLARARTAFIETAEEAGILIGDAVRLLAT